MKIKLTYKGGPGSGHFSHSGIPGEVGGSAPSGSSNIDYSDVSVVTTLAKLGSTKYEGKGYWIMPDGVMVDARKSGGESFHSYHEDAIRLLSVKNEAYRLKGVSPGKDAKRFEDYSKLAIEKGSIRVSGISSTNIETYHLDSDTLRLLQRHVDEGKIELKGQITWGGKILGTAGKYIPVHIKSSYAELMSAKHVIVRKLSGDHYIFELKQLEPKPITVTKGG